MYITAALVGAETLSLILSRESYYFMYFFLTICIRPYTSLLYSCVCVGARLELAVCRLFSSFFPFATRLNGFIDWAEDARLPLFNSYIRCVCSIYIYLAICVLF